jgi:uncharacterized protein YqjF (DUF2071 family)
MLNYQVDPTLLEPLVPRGTSLDRWQGATYVSLVGFLFRDTRVLGAPVPLHRDFEEVNLRFYVRREVDGEMRRGVTFIREIVPRLAIATVARLAYNEPYVTLPMRHDIAAQATEDAAPSSVRYEWRQRAGWSTLAVEASGIATPLAPDSEAEFITEHYWGYTRQRDGGTVEYHVSHPRWRTWTVDAGHRARRSGRAVWRAPRRRAASAPGFRVPRRRVGDRGAHARAVGALSTATLRAARSASPRADPGVTRTGSSYNPGRRWKQSRRRSPRGPARCPPSVVIRLGSTPSYSDSACLRLERTGVVALRVHTPATPFGQVEPGFPSPSSP